MYCLLLQLQLALHRLVCQGRFCWLAWSGQKDGVAHCKNGCLHRCLFSLHFFVVDQPDGFGNVLPSMGCLHSFDEAIPGRKILEIVPRTILYLRICIRSGPVSHLTTRAHKTQTRPLLTYCFVGTASSDRGSGSHLIGIRDK